MRKILLPLLSAIMAVVLSWCFGRPEGLSEKARTKLENEVVWLENNSGAILEFASGMKKDWIVWIRTANNNFKRVISVSGKDLDPAIYARYFNDLTKLGLSSIDLNSDGSSLNAWKNLCNNGCEAEMEFREAIFIYSDKRVQTVANAQNWMAIVRRLVGKNWSISQPCDRNQCHE